MYLNVKVFVLVLILLKCAAKNPSHCNCHEQNGPICNTESCVRASSTILQYIDDKVNPCEDFYQYVCGNFMKNAYVDNTPSPWSKMRTRFRKQLKSIIVEAVTDSDPKPLIQVKKFYKSCMNVNELKRKNNFTFKRFLDGLGGWPMALGKRWKYEKFDWIEFFIKAQVSGLAAPSFIDFWKQGVDGKNTMVLDVMINAENLENVIEKDFYKNMTRIVRKIYGKKIIINKREFHRFIDFYLEYKEISETVDYSPSSQPVKINDLSLRIPEIPWLRLVNQGLGFNFTGEDSIYLFVEEGVKKIIELLRVTDIRTQANFLVWNIVKSFENYLDLDLNLEETLPQRHKTCLNKVDELFPNYIETVFIRRTANAKMREQVNALIESIKHEFIQKIKSADWMDERTKKLGVEKAKALVNIIGGTNEMYNSSYFDKILGLDDFYFRSNNLVEMVCQRAQKLRESFVDNLLANSPDYGYIYFFGIINEPNAYFYQKQNAMILPASILDYPFFDPNSPKFVNYGSLGSIIGHEMMHGFTKDSRVYTLSNATEVDWWDDQVEKNFDRKAQCVVKQYETLETNLKQEMHGNLTLYENIADFVGIDVAYQAYRTHVKGNKEEATLPGLKLTPNQLYWVQANVFKCFQKIDSHILDLNKPNKHGIPKFRINASVRNSRHFAKDFNCPENSPMNPREKCHLL